MRLPTPLTRARHLAHFCGRALRRPRNWIAKQSRPLSPESFSPPVNYRSMDNEAKCTTSAS